MPSTIRMDRSGRLVLPKALRDQFRLSGEAEFRVQLVGDHLELTPEITEEHPPVIRKSGLLVVSASGTPCDAADALQTQRDERMDFLSGESDTPHR